MLESESTAVAAVRPKRSLALRQLSLLELFYINTLVAVFVGVYIYVSPLFAMLGAGIFLVIGTVRACGAANLVLGGLVGFAVASFVGWLTIVMNRGDTSAIVGMLLLFPSAGYVVGAFMAELRRAEI